MEDRHGDEIRLSDLSGHELIGEGGCGAVFRVKDRDGRALSLKLLDEAAINAGLLEKTTARLEAGGWPEGVMPVIAADFNASPPFMLSPLVVSTDDSRPSSLQHRLDEHPGLDTWKTIKSIARALAAMHARHVPHGNLKPGNVFIDENGAPLLRDWALGHMPGIRRHDFTDALLYQPPEQLRDAARHVDDGYRCDVFAFGVLAFRLLTGCFPRCHATFSQVAPQVGETRREGIRADLARIATNLEAQAAIHWPEQSASPLEQQMREWIEKCLELNPAKRPCDMGEVAAGLAGIDQADSSSGPQEVLLDQSRHAGQRARRAWFFAGFASTVAILFAALWHLRGVEMAALAQRHADEIGRTRQAADAAVDTAETQAAETAKALADERESWLARLKAAHETGDRLFGWALEASRRNLPPLDGREARLKRLEAYFQDFIERHADMPDLVEECALARLQLAEISLSRGDSVAATTRLDEALRIWKGQPMGSELRMRVAADKLLLALLRQARSEPTADAAFTAAREAFAAVPRADVDAVRLDQLLSALDFHEAKMHAARGDDTKALEQLMRATQTLNRIAGERADSAILSSALAASNLATADLLDGLGSPADAREVRVHALGELAKLLEKNPSDVALRLELAGCHGAVAEAAMLAGDSKSTDTHSREALKLLDAVLAAQPGHHEAVSRKAAQLGLRACLLQDQGQAAEAMRLFDEGILMLEGIRAAEPGDVMSSFHLATLWWQKGRMIADMGNHDEGVALLGQARDLLGSLQSSNAVAGPRPEQVTRAAAYLAGDLGHALQLAQRKGDAARAFEAAVNHWQALCNMQPENEEYQEGLNWSRQRLEDLK